jgi:hypothetical protein
VRTVKVIGFIALDDDEELDEDRTSISDLEDVTVEEVGA